MVRPRNLRVPVETTRPAFGNYAFVELVENSADIARESPNLNYLMWQEGKLVIVSDEVVCDIKRRERAGEFDLMPEDIAAKFGKGVKVMVIAGPMEGCKGIVVRKAVRGGKARIDIGGRVVDLPLVLLKNCE